MARGANKVAISLPSELYRAVEQVRKKTGRTRSALLQDALRHWLRHQADAALVREYEAGYRRHPEGKREVKTAEAAAVRLLATEEW